MVVFFILLLRALQPLLAMPSQT